MKIVTNYYLTKEDVQKALQKCITSKNPNFSIIYNQHTNGSFSTISLKHITPKSLGCSNEKYAIITVVPIITQYQDKHSYFKSCVTSKHTQFATLDMFVSAFRKEGSHTDLEYTLQNKKCILILDEVDEVIKSQAYIIDEFIKSKSIKYVIGVTASLPANFKKYGVKHKLENDIYKPLKFKRVKVCIKPLRYKKINEHFFESIYIELRFQAKIDELINSNSYEGDKGLYIVVPEYFYYHKALMVLKQNNKKCIVINEQKNINCATRLSTELQSAITTNENDTNIYLATSAGVRGINLPFKKEWDILVMATNQGGIVTFSDVEFKQINGRPNVFVNADTGDVIEPVINSYYFFSERHKLTKHHYRRRYNTCYRHDWCGEFRRLAKSKKYLSGSKKEKYGDFIYTVKDKYGFDKLRFSKLIFDYMRWLQIDYDKYKWFETKRKRVFKKKIDTHLPDNVFRSYTAYCFNPLPNESTSLKQWFIDTECKSIPLAFYVRGGKEFCTIENITNSNLYKVEGTKQLDKIIDGVKDILFYELFKAPKPLKTFNDCKEQIKETEDIKEDLKTILRPLLNADRPLKAKYAIIKAQKAVKEAQMRLMEEVTNYLLTLLNLTQSNVVYYRDYNILTFYGSRVQSAVCDLLNANGMHARVYNKTTQTANCMIDYVKQYESEGYSQIKAKKIIYYGDKEKNKEIHKRFKIQTNDMINGVSEGKNVSAYVKQCFNLFTKLLKDKSSPLYKRSYHELYTFKEKENITKAIRLIKANNPVLYCSRLHDSITVVSFKHFTLPTD